jgi:hypothetical protein
MTPAFSPVMTSAGTPVSTLAHTGAWAAAVSTCVGGGEKGGQFGGQDGAKCGVTLWPVVGAGMGEERRPSLSGRIVFGFDQWGAVSLAFDLEDDRSFDQAIEEIQGCRMRLFGGNVEYVEYVEH